MEKEQKRKDANRMLAQTVRLHIEVRKQREV